LDSLPPPPGEARFGEVRYHDACQLGRGLGEYDAPRALLERALGRPPREFRQNRGAARCSGGGGLLPTTRPETASQIAAERVREHERLGGGKIVTACARSLTQFRAAGADAVDLVTVIRSLTGR
jgi:Fe-S oxidoreductase